MTSVKTLIKIEKYLKNFFIIHVMYVIDYTPYKLRDWVCTPFEKVFWMNLSENPNAIHLLEQNPDKIKWECLSSNPKCYSFIGTKPRKNRLVVFII